MNVARLTAPSRIAHKAGMHRRDETRRPLRANTLILAAAALAPVLLSGCITINAPEDAIVIELNINITQEVIYRLAEDVRENIEENPEIF